MSDGKGPWDLPPEPKPQQQRPDQVWRVLIWLGVIAAGAVGVWALSRAFPGRVSGSDWYYPLNGLGFLLLLSTGILVSRRMPVRQIAFYLGGWTAIAAILLVGYTFHDDLMDAGLRLRSELIPGYAAPATHGAVALSQNRDGGYEVVGEVDGQKVRFAIDTGASDIVLSPADARRIGIDTASLDFSRSYETANGAGHGARAVVDTLEVGPIRLSHVPVSINQADMSQSLLGMAFLRRLDSFEFRHGELILRPAKT
jgi:aspartyl protease family protein